MRDLDAFREIRKQKNYSKAVELVPYAKFMGITMKETSAGLIFTMPFTADKIGNVLFMAGL